MKVKHVVYLGIPLFIALAIVGYLVYDEMTMTEQEVVNHLENLHQTKIKVVGVKSTKGGELYTLKALERPSSFYFEALVSSDKNNKAYIKSSTYSSEKAKQGVGTKINEFLPFLKDLGFDLYYGGTIIPKQEGALGEGISEESSETAQREPEIEPYAVGITDDGTPITRISLIYKEPLTLFTLNDSYDTLFNAVKAVKGMELTNPYLDIRGKDGESTSGRVILADLDTLNSAEDVFKQVTNAIEDSANVPSITLTDEEIEALNKDKE